MLQFSARVCQKVFVQINITEDNAILLSYSESAVVNDATSEYEANVSEI